MLSTCYHSRSVQARLKIKCLQLFKTHHNTPQISQTTKSSSSCSRSLFQYSKYSAQSCNQYICQNNLINSCQAWPQLVSRQFHTSPRHHIPPVLMILMKPLMRGTAMLTGWVFRTWWRKLPQEEKNKFLKSLWKHRMKFLAGTGVIGTLMGLYYYEHINETPITKRRRFLALSPSQFEKISDLIYEDQLDEFKSQLLNKNHHQTQRVARIANRLLEANKDIRELYDKKWAVSVIDSPIRNAFVLPNGQMFVFTGMLDACVNDDQLGGILAHEMAHTILSHGAEQLSFAHLLDWVAIAFITAIWAFLPSNTLAALTHWIFNKITVLLFNLPYNRMLEMEADVVGLQLAAKACFDVREMSAFWERIALTEKIASGEDIADIEWLSTHPSHETRSTFLDEKIPEALELRSSCGCPKLQGADPRVEVARFKEALEKHLAERAKGKLEDKAVVVLAIPKPLSPVNK